MKGERSRRGPTAAARTDPWEDTVKQYLLSIYQPDGDPPPPETLAAVMRDVEAWNQELKAAGAWVFTGGLHPPDTATVVRVRTGDMLTTDGPYVEGKEHIGGFTVIRAPDLDAALEWGRKLAQATMLPVGDPASRTGLPIEVRPLQGEVEG
jgi:hypothetical protein